MARSLGRHRHSFFATVALLTFAVAPIALAQSATKAKKKGAKPAASASASASASAEPTPSAEPAAEPTAAPTESAPPDVAPAASISNVDVADDITNTLEDPNKTYRFVGLRYRGTIIPAFFEHLFVADGGTIYSNSIGAEFDFRKDSKSTIVWLQYNEYSFGNTLFLQKGVTDEQQNYSIVSSSLKGIYLGVDEIWSTPIAHHLDFEYGFGLGLGVIFGNLYNSWVYQGNSSSPGAIQASNSNYYAPCGATTNGPLLMGATYSSCDPRAHSNSSNVKVANYTEPSWLHGGSVPVIFPHIAGQIGIRYKPIKQLESRFDLGVSLTGFWFGISADYGLEDTEHDTSHSAAQPPTNPSPQSDPPASGDKSSLEDGTRATL